MSRGNRRERILGEPEDKGLFLSTLGQTCERTGWMVHAYVLMDNHFHLLLETPESNLSEGMRWLQGTYGTRYNRAHGLSGHVWQGRFKSPLISDEGDEPFLRVSRYIHLNPVRAGLLDEKEPVLFNYRWSSFPWLCRAGSSRPDWLHAEPTYWVYGLPGDDTASRRKYRKRMELTARECLRGELDEEMAADRRRLARGWYIGEKSFRDRMLDAAEQAVQGRRSDSLRGGAKRACMESRASEIVDKACAFYGIPLDAMKKVAKNDPRKRALTGMLRSHTAVSYRWIIERLSMGSTSSVYQALRAIRLGEDKKLKSTLRELERVIKCDH